MTNVHIVLGPTASGKTSRALSMAREMDGVIINADSMQIYDALHVLTAQPSPEEQAQAPHLLYSVLGPSEACTAQRWTDMAVETIDRVLDQGQVPILVGGTGFYIKALTEGLSPVPEIPDTIRAETEATQKALGNPAFHDALSKKDPVMAKRLNPQDSQRLMRAWEVLEATGKSLSYWQELPPVKAERNWQYIYDIEIPDRALLHENIERRLKAMVDEGILDEVEALDKLIKSGDVAPEALITKAIGFRPFRTYLYGESTLEEAHERACIETRQYAKRQITWIRHQTPYENDKE